VTLEGVQAGLEATDVTVDCLESGRRLVIFGQPPAPATIAAYVDGEVWSLLSIDAPEPEFQLGVRSIVDGPPFASSSLVRILAASARESAGRPLAERLTRREREVLLLLAEGASNREAAEALGVSPNTVRTHVQSLLTKVGATSRTKLVVRARSLGLLN
jgi:DNA-binding NarL/FixJ family response regulator